MEKSKSIPCNAILVPCSKCRRRKNDIDSILFFRRVAFGVNSINIRSNKTKHKYYSYTVLIYHSRGLGGFRLFIKPILQLMVGQLIINLSYTSC